MLIAIWAEDKNGLIGKNLELPWRLPNDVKFFKEQTMGHPIVMGRKTFEGMDFKSLPKRENIILTRHKDKFTDMAVDDNVVFTDDVAEIVRRGKNEDILVIGGKEIFEVLWPDMDKLLITRIDGEFEGDTYFTPDLSDFEIYRQDEGVVDEKNVYPHTFYFYQRK